MRYGGPPITDEEALGVARRLATVRETPGRKLSNMSAPGELPAPNAPAVQAAYRLPPRLLMRARAKAEMEGRTVTSVIIDALEGYASSSPGSRQRWVAPRLVREASAAWRPPAPRVRAPRRRPAPGG